MIQITHRNWFPTMTGLGFHFGRGLKRPIPLPQPYPDKTRTADAPPDHVQLPVAIHITNHDLPCGPIAIVGSQTARQGTSKRSIAVARFNTNCPISGWALAKQIGIAIAIKVGNSKREER